MPVRNVSSNCDWGAEIGFTPFRSEPKARPAAPPAAHPAAPAPTAKHEPAVNVTTRVGMGEGSAPSGQKFAATFENVTLTPKKPLLKLNESGSINVTGNVGLRNVQAHTELNGKTSEASYHTVNASVRLNDKMTKSTTLYAEAGGEAYYMNAGNGRTGPLDADKTFAQVSVGANHTVTLSDTTTLDLGVRAREAQFTNYNTDAPATRTDRLAATAKVTHKIDDITKISASLFVERQHNHATGENRNIESLNAEWSRKVGGGTLALGADVGLDKTNKFDDDTSYGSRGSAAYAQWSIDF